MFDLDHLPRRQGENQNTIQAQMTQMGTDMEREYDCVRRQGARIAWIETVPI
jgi:hypothetical protein